MTNPKASGTGNSSRTGGGGAGNSKSASAKNRSPKVKVQSKLTKASSTGGGSRGKAGNAGAAGGAPPKRARSSAAATREAKRARTEAGSKPTTPRTSTPTSPTSSRSRPRKQSASAAAAKASAKTKQAAANNNNNSGSNASGKPPPKNARATTSRQMASRNTLTQQANVNLFIDGMPVPADIKNTNVVRRLFGQEIQCVMHSFGETRACSRDTLELVEDAVRVAVRRVIGEAASIADFDGVGGPVTLEVQHIAHIIRRDPRAMYRFNQTIRLAAEQYGTRPEAVELRKYCKNRAAPKPWDTIAELADLGDGSADNASAQGQYLQDPWKYCTWKAYHMFRNLMPQPTFNDYVKCRSTNLVTSVSRSQWAKIAEQPRFLMFQRWLDLDPSDDVKISLGALYALGHIAWECIGVLTQTALIQMHFDNINTGAVELRCSGWSYARHLLASLGHGIATAVLLPLTDIQLQYLRQEVERLPMLAMMGPDYWKGNKATAPKSLCPKHIREALRRNDFADSVLLSILRGRYGTNSSY